MPGASRCPPRLARAILVVLCLAAPAAARCATVSAVDDTGATVQLPGSAQRIVSLAPHATEILFAAGAGKQVVGVVRWSDYPEAATRVPLIGDTFSLDFERILALDPDLVVAWSSGNGAANIARLRELGLTLFISEPRDLETIGDTIRRLGILTGHREEAEGEALRFRDTLTALRRDFADRATVRVFYQIWHQPIFTVNGDHIISRVMDVCGGTNVFADLSTLSPQVGLEAVIAADPEVILASGADNDRPDWLDDWRRWPQLPAVRGDHLYFIPPALIQRHTPRILEGAAQMCAALDKVRKRR